MLRLQAINAVKAALLLIDGTPTEWSTNVLGQGLKPNLKNFEQISPDETPWLCVVGGDSRRVIPADVNFGKKKEQIDVVIWAVQRPDELRYPGQSAFDLMELCIADVQKTLEDNVEVLSCGSLTGYGCEVTLDPLARFAFQEHRLTYTVSGTLGA